MNITKCKCPSCKGTGIGLFGICMWCEGQKKLDKADAIRWANQCYSLGSGGYIAGDHSYEDGELMKNEANAVYRLFGLKPINAL